MTVSSEITTKKLKLNKMNQKPINDHEMIRRYCKNWHTCVQWAQRGFGVKLSTRCGEMLRNGENIESRWTTLATGKKVKQYRFVKQPTKN